MRMELVLFIGIQATGKSTFYHHHFFHTHIRLNMDMLRTRHREMLLLTACLNAKQAIVIDNTNPTAAERARYIAPAREARFRVVGYYFRSVPADALRRNQQRTGNARIPDKGILGTYKRLELPRYEEGFDILHYVTLDEATGIFHIEEWNDAI
jgi:predicted kinase